MTDDPATTASGGGDDSGAALEARLVAWVLGEASAFEAAELERLIARQPELALFKRRIEAVHGLLSDAAQVRRDSKLRLTPVRRARLLAAFSSNTGTKLEATAEPAAAPAVAEPQGPGQGRRFAGDWKALRLYFGVTAACLVACVLVVQLATPPSRSAGITGARDSAYSFEAEPRVRQRAAEERARAVERSKSLGSMTDAEFAAELARREEELLLAEHELAIMEGRVPQDTPFAQVLEMPALTSVGAVTVPVARSIGQDRSRPSGSLNLAALDAPADDEDRFDTEPETVPEGDDDQRVELAPFEVRATSEVSYTAAQTLAGTRISTTLRDLGSHVSVASNATLQDQASSARPASTFKAEQGDWAEREPNPGAAATWTAGFGDAASATGSSVPPAPRPNPGASLVADGDGLEARGGTVTRVTRGFLGDVGATASDTLLQYTVNSEVGGVRGNYSMDTPEPPPITRPAPGLSQDAWQQGFGGEAAPANPVLFGSSRPGANLRSRGIGTSADALAPPPSAPLASEADGRAKRPPAPASAPAVVDEVHATREPASTFSLHVGDVSFRLALAALGRGELPEAGSIRPEEFYNAFDYDDPAPTLGQKVACRLEQAAHPFLQQRTLVRVAMKVAASGRGAGQPLRLTVLLDTSGSMEREDRAALVSRALEVLATLLGPADRVTLIGFSRRPQLLAEAVPGNDARRLVEVVAHTPASGGTNLEEALKLGAELARRHFDRAARNRLVLITDGAANLGNADPEQLAARIEALRGEGIAFDACGVGSDGLDDGVLEALTRRGDGRYYVLDAPGDADAGFARQLAGAFRPAAGNVKVQVRFNPARVGAYRLIGFEKHRLREEDFRNDRVDAAELAAEEGAVALYQVEVLPEGEGELGEVYVRFRDMSDGRMVERSWTIVHDSRVKSFDRAAPGIQLAGTAALLAEVMRGGAAADAVDLAALAPVVGELRGRHATRPRVQELATMFDQLRRALGR